MSSAQLVPLGRCVSEVRQRNVGGREQNLLSLSYGRIIRKDIESLDGLLPESFDSYTVVRMGDSVLRLTDLQNDQRSIRVGLAEERGIITSAYITVRPLPHVDARYLNYFLKAMDARKDFYALGAGVRQSLKFDELRGQKMHVPALPVQRAIADYLDAETARIDALIAKKQRMMSLLRERARGEIAECTRRGLDSSVRLVESGLEWVGDMPSHWRVVPNWHAMTLARRPVTIGKEPTLLSLSKQGVIVRDTSENAGKFPASFDTYQVVSAGDIVLCLFDMAETPRTVGLATTTGMVTGAYDVMVARDRIALPGFLSYLYEGFDDEKSLSLFYTGLRNVIRPRDFLNIRMPLPPLAEQLQIVRELDGRLRRWRDAMTLLEGQITLLRERRSALVAAAVSGEHEIPGVVA